MSNKRFLPFHAASRGSFLSVLLACLVVAWGSSLTGRAAQVDQTPKWAADRILVRFSPHASDAAREHARGLVAGQRLREYVLVPGLELIRVPAQAGGIERALQALAQHPAVQYAEPDYLVQACGTPSDPQWPNLWGMANINAPTAWDTYTGDSSLVVAIIDTGIDYNHPDLADNIWTNPGEIPGNGIDDDHNGYIDDIHGWDFAYHDNNPSDVYGHGTHTAGTVGAVGDNGLGVVGVNWQVKLMALKFLDDNGSGYTSDAVSAVQYAAMMGAKVSNNSWGGGGYSKALYNAINAAKSVGHLFIAAAGNSGGNNDVSPFYPASYTLDNIIAVAAIDSADNKASWSCYGATSVDLGAPGVNILSTVPSDDYAYSSGTSMATPHVAGAAALLYGYHPTWSYGQVRDQILGSARPIVALRGKTVTGGTLDLAAAVAGAPTVPTMHVKSIEMSLSKSGKNYTATAKVTIVDAAGTVASATVTGDWTFRGMPQVTRSGITGTTGAASIKSNAAKAVKDDVFKFIVTGVSRSGYTYDPSKNVETSDEIAVP